MWFIILSIVAIAVLVHYLITSPYKYFNKLGIYSLPATPYADLYKMLTNDIEISALFTNLYKAEPSKKYYGAFVLKMPTILLRDPEIIQKLTIKDFEHFTDHNDTFVSEELDPLRGKSLFALKGKRWHQMRTTLSPTFTGSKMRGMFEMIAECGDQLVSYLNTLCKENPKEVYEVDLKTVSVKFTNDVIATTAFGIKIDSFTNPNNEFYTVAQQLGTFAAWKLFLMGSLPKVAKYFKVNLSQPHIYHFFMNLVRNTIETRERENIVRPDMLHLLMQAKKEVEEKNASDDLNDIVNKNNQLKLTLEDITAQSFVFFNAGSEPVSSAMNFSLYEITINPEIQKRLQAEIDESSKQGSFTYEALSKMKYLDMIVSECLRKWSPAVAVDRVCVKKYALEIDGEKLVFEPGMLVHLPILNIHRDAKYFPNPEHFDPERFSDENKDKIKPGAYNPFGIGPGHCIASRFALMEIKIFLVYLFKNFSLEVIDKTPIPIKLRKQAGTLDSADGFWFRIIPRH